MYAVVDAEMHLNLYWWLHLVRGSVGIRDEVGTESAEEQGPWRNTEYQVRRPDVRSR